MKKILFTLFVLFALASCSEEKKDQVKEEATPEMVKEAEEKIEKLDNQVKELENSIKETEEAINDLDNI